LYLRGRYHWARVSQSELQLAVKAFRDAVGRDSGFALAYAGLADAEVRLATLGSSPDPQVLDRASRAIQRALSLNPRLAEAHASLGFLLVNRRELEKAEAAFREAIRLNPRYPWAHHYYSMLLTIQGRVEESLEENRRLLELDPLSLAGNANRGVILCSAGDYAGARRHLRRTLDLVPDFPLALYYQGVLDVRERRYPEAIAALERVWQLVPGFPGTLGALAFAHRQAGHLAAADSVMRLIGPARDGRASLFLGQALAIRGEIDSALPQLERAKWSLASLVNLRADPLMIPLRNDPRYPGLIKQLGISAPSVP
jgi:tetratricopeptide (TPR) repeat protein